MWEGRWRIYARQQRLGEAVAASTWFGGSEMQGGDYHSKYRSVSSESNDAHPNPNVSQAWYGYNTCGKVEGGNVCGNNSCGNAAPAAAWFGGSEMQSGDYHSMYK
eukprot:14124056-Ditylum_brightwellii.AAC.1